MGYSYQDETLYCEQVPVADIAAQAGTPLYIYSQADIVDRYRAYDQSFGDLDHRVCYAVKANSNLSILRLLAAEGAGFDIVSGGELFRVLKAGGDPASIVFAGVGKTSEEIEFALKSKIHAFSCESEAEIHLIGALAQRHNVTARIGLRVNPDVNAATHPYISTGLREHKFGIDISEVEAVYARYAHLPHIALEGVSCHIGSQMLDADPIFEAVEKMVALVERLRATGLPIRYLDLGGGLGVPYKANEQSPGIAGVVAGIRRRVQGHQLRVMVEPGRSIVAEAGALITRVLYRKQTPRKEFLITDAAMNDLIRPALYQSHHEILPLRKTHDNAVMHADVVGPICETGDFLARNRELPNILPGDLLAIMTAGAYGFVQASNYNTRPRAAEVLVHGASWKIIRARETMEDLIRGE